MYQKVHQYFKENPIYNALIHWAIGLGMGILITYPLVQTHPVRVGLALVAIGLLGHLYPLITKK